MYLPLIGFIVLLTSHPPRISAIGRINFTRLLEEALLGAETEKFEDRRVPKTIDDVSYLPEADYFENREIDGSKRSSQLTRFDRNLLPEYRSLCEIMTRKTQMNDDDYEYQPPHYHEIFCKSYSFIDETQRTSVKPAKQRCAHPGFHCVQRSRTLFMVRRRWDGDCWEPFTKEIASGCDCMWPVSSLGEISAHY